MSEGSESDKLSGSSDDDENLEQLEISRNDALRPHAGNDFVLPGISQPEMLLDLARRAVPVRRPLNQGEWLCAACQLIDLKLANFLRYPIDAKLPPVTNLGDFKKIRKSRECALCRLLTRALGAQEYNTHRDNFGCLAVWLRDGISREVHNGTEDQGFTTLRLRVIPDDDREFEPIDFAPLRGSLGSQESFTGRLLRPDRIDVGHLRAWLDNCVEWHKHDCAEIPWQAALQPLQAFRLIDVRSRSLVDSATPCRYAALSYVWGAGPVFKTTKSNCAKLYLVDSLEHVEPPLPRTIREAMDLVADVGERYLWVDSICIVQDDERDKTRQIALMDTIYGNAFFTIVVATGSDANAGLPGTGAHTRNLCQDMQQCAPDLTLLQLQPSCQAVMDSSTWNRRGWTYQERLLSRRCIVFANESVYYQCNRAIWSEDYAAEDRLVLRQDHTIRTISTPYFEEYRRIIAEYTRRSLSFQSDRLAAVSGILQVFQNVFGIKFHFGLPEAMFDAALLWQPASRPKRVVLDNVPAERQFPSWSWTGWENAVEYEHTGTSSGLTPINDHYRRTISLQAWEKCDRHGNNTTFLNGDGRAGYRNPPVALPQDWVAQETGDLDGSIDHGMVYMRTSQPHLFHSAPPTELPLPATTQLDERHLPKSSPRYLKLTTEIAKFCLDDINKGRRSYRKWERRLDRTTKGAIAFTIVRILGVAQRCCLGSTSISLVCPLSS